MFHEGVLAERMIGREHSWAISAHSPCWPRFTFAPITTMAAPAPVDADPITLSRFILEGQAGHPEARGDLTIIMMAIQTATKVISSAVRKAGIAGLYGLEGAVNVQGEDVKKLDIVANDNFINLLRSTGKVGVMVSEEVRCTGGFPPSRGPRRRCRPRGFDWIVMVVGFAAWSGVREPFAPRVGPLAFCGS